MGRPTFTDRSGAPTERLSELPQPPTNPPDPKALSKLLFPHHRDIRRKMFDLLKEPIFERRFGLTVQQHRALTHARIARLSEAGCFTATISTATSGGSRRFDVMGDIAYMLDHSLETELGVSFGLFGGSVHALGTPQQYTYWLKRIESLHDFGCFALTELGHGSNVRGIETTAVYDGTQRQFILHTPCETAQKYWIGGAAEAASVAVVFAQLRVDGVEHGVHGFIVRLRDQDGHVVNGVQIADCGVKMGLNGVDNGRIWFSNHRVPRTALLSKLSRVTEDGRFESSISSPDVRFGAMLAALTGGRVSIAIRGVLAALLGLTIAIRYSFSRRAFAPFKGAAEVPLIFYRSQQRALMIPLATALVYLPCGEDLRDDWYHAVDSGVVSKHVHVTSAGYKALFTWFMADGLQKAREACGGQGYKSENVIAPLRADRDVMLTFEGANSVMLHQVGKQLIAECGIAAKNGGRFASGSPVEALNDMPPVVDVDGSSDGPRLTSAFVTLAFWKREKAVVGELWRTYTAAMKKRKGQHFYAWNDCLGVAERAAVCFMHRRIFEAHLIHIEKARRADAGCGEALTLCGILWAADIICKDVDFLRFQCVSSRDVTVAMESVDGLCERMTGMADLLLEGVGFPDHLLAPIAIDFVKHNSRPKL